MTENNVKINYNVTGAKRKELVKLISNFTGYDAKYKGAPSFAYEVDYFTIDKNGTLIFDNRADSEVIERLQQMLYDNGFVAEPDETEPAETEPAVQEEAAPAPQEEGTNLTIEIPHDAVDSLNLMRLMEAKGNLIKEALGMDDVVIPTENEPVSFRWNGSVEPCDVKAYTEFVSALCAFTKKQKRINAVESKVENKKYAFRCFLLRLGFIGQEYKETRKILLRNLEGSSAFRDGKKAEVKSNG